MGALASTACAARLGALGRTESAGRQAPQVAAASLAQRADMALTGRLGSQAPTAVLAPEVHLDFQARRGTMPRSWSTQKSGR